MGKGILGPSTKAGEEESRWKGKGVKEGRDGGGVGREGGGVDESASLSFVVQMLLVTVTG